MKTKIMLSFVLLLTTVLTLSAQDCTFFYPMEEGTIIEMKHFDKKEKLSGITRQEIIEKKLGSNGITLTIRNTSFDEKGKELMSSDLTMECRNGVFTFDMSNYINDEMLAGMKEMEFTMEGDNLEFPSNMKAGDMLKDGKIRLLVEDMPMMNMTTTVYNRKVEAVENISTEAGTFECYKISYEVLTDAMIDVQTRGIEWIAPETGAVRTESYNKNGKLMGYSVLSRLEK
jgi:hypothetical protein